MESEVEPARVRELITRWRPVGCLVDRAMAGGTNPKALFGGLPVVYLDQDPAKLRGKVFRVTHDSAATARLAVDELMSLDLPAYAYVGWEKPFFWSEERKRAFRAVAHKAGRRFFSFDPSAGGNLDDWLMNLPKPCGLLGANDIVAEKVLFACHRQGIAVPQDLALAGIDDDELICTNVRPSLTSVQPDFNLAGWLLASLLDEQLSEPSAKPRELTYGPIGFVRRESTRRFQKSDARVKRAIELIRAKACAGLSVPEVVRTMGCSRRLADLRFREVTGHSILDEIHEVRMSRVRTLLRDLDMPIGRIAAACGYVSEPFLKRLFRSREGCSMREWRSRLSSGFAG